MNDISVCYVFFSHSFIQFIDLTTENYEWAINEFSVHATSQRISGFAREKYYVYLYYRGGH